ncbi:uncharacterized protein LOC114251378 [Bombyx mandarina]|uniref:Uncharacterized protein LOC114251378 n=1 Tax=Bombyx mandarina TaxID=7092 RepID=A0A6J2KIN2_BOMMA|nr:uncharacterized protein LOC114251378 [Bombyx mandarina]
MLKEIVLLLGVVTLSNARPDLLDLDSRNVITVPPNCPGGQQWINGQCRDVWRNAATPSNMITVPPNCLPGQVYINGQCRDVWRNEASPSNMITVPPNCPPGQVYINGQCRDVWRNEASPSNMITVPPNCPPGQVYINGQCRDIWFKSIFGLSEKREPTPFANFPGNDEHVSSDTVEARNIISIPNQCPAGYRPDALGYCRKEFN